MTKYSLERGSYRSAGDVAKSVIIRALMSFMMTGFFIWIRFVFDFQIAVLFALAIIIVALWSLEKLYAK